MGAEEFAAEAGVSFKMVGSRRGRVMMKGSLVVPVLNTEPPVDRVADTTLVSIGRPGKRSA